MTSTKTHRRSAAAAAILLAVAAAGFTAGPPAAAPVSAVPPAESAPAASVAPHVVRVYYFRTTARCASCKKIEAYTDASVRTAFGREIASGALDWQVVNVQESGNGHFIQDYKLATKSVVVVDLVDGRQVRWKNLSRIWELLGDEASFKRYVEDEVRQYLEGRS